jgi:hypothetical protein
VISNVNSNRRATAARPAHVRVVMSRDRPNYSAQIFCRPKADHGLLSEPTWTIAVRPQPVTNGLDRIGIRGDVESSLQEINATSHIWFALIRRVGWSVAQFRLAEIRQAVAQRMDHHAGVTRVKGIDINVFHTVVAAMVGCPSMAISRSSSARMARS